MISDDESAVLDIIKVRLADYFPISGELCRIDLVDATLAQPDPRCRCDGPLFVSPWSVSLCVRTAAFDKMDTDGGLAICERGQLGDPRVVPCLEGQLMALTSVARLMTGPLVRRRWAIGYLNASLPLSALPRSATKDDYHRYYLTYPWLGRYLPGRPARAPAYVRAPAELCLRDGGLDVGGLRAWIGRQVARTFEDFAWDEAMIAALPEPVRVLEAVDGIHAMVGGNGFEVWLSQARGADVRRGYHGLGAIGASKLQALMAMGIALAASQGAEFSHEDDAGWARAIKARRPSDWRAIDGHEPDRSYALLESELVPLVHKYAEAHRLELIAVPRQEPIRRPRRA